MNTSIINVGARYCVNPNDVLRMQADINYTHIYFSDGRRKIVVAKTLKALQQKLAPYPSFFRISKSQIINLNCVKDIDEMQITLQDGEIIVPSRRRKRVLRQYLNA